MSDTQQKPAEPITGQEPEGSSHAHQRHPTSFAELPNYTRSLLKIRVPVRVVLARKKESLIDVVELAPGTIIKFDKPCDEMLHLFVGNQQVAEGEAVKVGDKFGFRTTTMTLPREHFCKVRKAKPD